MKDNALLFLKSNYRTLYAVLLVLIILALSSRHGYLLFHSLVEMFSIVVAFAVFIVTWNSRRMFDNPFLLLVGIAYLFIGALDLLHTLTFTGMGVFPDHEYFANQFWVATRALEAISLVTGFWFLAKKKTVNPDRSVVTYTVVTALIIASILVWDIFPECFIEGQGQTTFKIVAEWVIIAILLSALFLLYRFKEEFSKPVFRILSISIFFTILSEFCFTLYVSNYSMVNALGHYAKLISFYLIYKANVETAFTQPTASIFKNLKDNEERYKSLVANKDRFFSIIAHDLRNPFSSLINFSELIHKNSEKLGKSKVEDLARRMNVSAKLAHSLLETLLTWSQVQTGALKPVPEVLDAASLLRETLELSAAVATAKEVEVVVEGEISEKVLADRQMILTVLRNLTSNAIKFSYPQRQIVLRAERQQGQVLFSVTDEGIGIQKEQAERIFDFSEPYSSDGTRSEKGNGLGLILCAEFVAICGGTIGLKSEHGLGSTFYFTLPLAQI